ncbi:HEAT repeat domain-containing protein [Solirubrobacter soli]|uniref:HEAT repeat domain-containing protein n=1 Tax=Solirubrobacter soli TaxID=363832 RepID=UPI0004094E88|nr:HEAT repeat domain-containing protein [Solirubrobacter soli]
MTCEELDERIRAWQVFGEKADWLDEQSGLEPCIAAALDANRASGDWPTFEKYVIAALRHPSATYTETLGAVLDERRDDVNAEDIVSALEEARDPVAIPALRRAITWDADEFGQLQRKAVWALSHIGTPEALAAIRETVTPDMPEKVVEAAAQALS